MNSVEIKDKKSVLKAKANEIINRCKTEVRDMTEDEQKQVDEYKAEIKQLNEDLKALEERLSNLEDIEDTEAEETAEEENAEEEETETENTEKRNKNMKKEFRLLKAINDVANNKQMDATTASIVAQGAEEMRSAGISFGGQIQLPTEKRAVSVASTNGATVETTVGDIFEPLRGKSTLAKAGAKFIENLHGDVKIPVINGGSVTWEGETASASEIADTVSAVPLSPKRLTATLTISKKFLAQDSASAEAVLRADLANAVMEKLEQTVLGDGDDNSGKQPVGLFYQATVDTLASFGDVCDFEAKVEDANVNGECAYIMSNKAKSKMRQMIKGTNGTGMVYEGGEVDGTPAYNTSLIGSGNTNNVIYGDWSNLVVGIWNGIDLTVDPFTKAGDGCVVLTINFFCDAAAARKNAFAYGSL